MHKHEWRVNGAYGEGYWFECRCGVEMENDEIERRLNAVEELSAEQADDINDYYEMEYCFRRDELRAYAAKLRGSDE